MLILTPKDNLFNYDEAKKLHDQYADLLEDGCEFDELINYSHFFSFYDGEKFIGCIYFYKKDGKTFVNAFAGRKTHKSNIECLKKALNFYKCDIYANSTQKTAILCLLRAGFKKTDNNLYIYKRR